MKTQVATYGHCWNVLPTPAGLPMRGCQIEEIVDTSTMPHRITGPGRVLFKCSNHAGVPDDELYAVIHAEMLQVKEARRENEGKVLQTRFDGRGAHRKFSVEVL